MFTRRALNDKINGFLTELESNNFRVAKAILFGSYATGKVNENSDIDLAVWLSDLPEKHWTEIPGIPHIVAKYSPISPRSYDVNETGKDDPFIGIIEKTGKIIDISNSFCLDLSSSQCEFDVHLSRFNQSNFLTSL